MERGSRFGWFDFELFWDLEKEFGPERFQRFWSSEQGLEEAFQAAFGESIGAWTMRWARDKIGPMEASKPIPLQASLLSLLVIGLLGAMACGVQRRRA
jgi:hypothetical protein